MRFTISTQRFPFIIKSFYELYQTLEPDNFEIHVRETSMDHVISDVFEQKCELGVISISSLTERFIKKYLAQHKIAFHELVKITPCVFFHREHPMSKYDEIDIADMSPYPFVSFESDAAVALDFSEETIISEAPRFKKHFFVIDRATVINLLTNTDAFSIGSGILSRGFAGPELVSRPIKGHKDELKLGYICFEKAHLSDNAELLIQKINEVLYNIGE